MKIEVELESDGRWVAEVPSVPGAMAYGASRAEAVSKVEALVLRILADRRGCCPHRRRREGRTLVRFEALI